MSAFSRILWKSVQQFCVILLTYKLTNAHENITSLTEVKENLNSTFITVQTRIATCADRSDWYRTLYRRMVSVECGTHGYRAPMYRQAISVRSFFTVRSASGDNPQRDFTVYRLCIHMRGGSFPRRLTRAERTRDAIRRPTSYFCFFLYTCSWWTQAGKNWRRYHGISAISTEQLCPSDRPFVTIVIGVIIPHHFTFLFPNSVSAREGKT